MKTSALIILITAAACLPGEAPSPRLPPLKGMASVEFGMLQEAYISPTKQWDHETLQRGSAWLFQNVNLSGALDIHLGVGVMSFTVLDRTSVPEAQARRMAPGIAVAKARYTLGGRDNEVFPLRLEMGLIPFKYNPHAKNLGEYMFRSSVMPIQIFTGGLDIVEMAKGYVTGLHLEGKIGPEFHWDAFYTLNMDRPPLKGHNLTFMADYNASGIFELGFGVQFQNFWHDRGSQLQPKEADNQAYKATSVSGGEKNFYAQFLKSGAYETKVEGAVYALEIHDVTNASGSVISRQVGYTDNTSAFVPMYTITDSSYYSFKGAKVMGRAAFNLAPLLDTELLGPRDLSFYAEAILMGAQKVPVFGETLRERLPIMFGFNLPAFKLLDVLSLEFEVLKLKYNTSNARILGEKNLPVYAAISPTENQTDDDWKFTLYAEKTLIHGLKLYGQVARDHLRSMDLFSKYDFEETTQRGGGSFTDWGDFYWLLKLQLTF